MKTKLFTLALLCVSPAVFAQGKVAMVNDGTRFIYFESTEPADAAFQGKKVPAVLPSGITLMVDLYGGTSPGSMVLQTSTTISPAIAGGFGPVNFISPNMAGGVVGFWQIQVRDAVYPTESLSAGLGSYYGHSAIFQGRAGSSLAFFGINNALANNFQSTWQPGTFDLGGGEFGAIAIFTDLPEPSSLTIIGLGVACSQFFRRRK